MPFRIGDVDVTAMIEKDADDVGTSKLGSPVYWLSSREVLRVKRRAGLNQRLRDFGIGHPEKWCAATLPRAIDVGAGFEKESNQVEFPGLNGDMQRATAHMPRGFARFGLSREYLLQPLDVRVARSSQDFGPAVETVVKRVIHGLLGSEIQPSPSHASIPCSR